MNIYCLSFIRWVLPVCFLPYYRINTWKTNISLLIPQKKLKKTVTLKSIKANKKLAEMKLIKISRLSVVPVTSFEFDEIINMSESWKSNFSFFVHFGLYRYTHMPNWLNQRVSKKKIRIMTNPLLLLTKGKWFSTLQRNQRLRIGGTQTPAYSTRHAS